MAEINRQPGDAPMPITSCPIAVEYGISLLDLDREAGRLRISADLGERWLNGGGVIQGGITAGVLDFAMAFVVLAKLGSNQALATTNLDVNYLRPAFPGIYECVGEIVSVGRTVAFLKAELFSADGKCVGTATSTGMIVTP